MNDEKFSPSQITQPTTSDITVTQTTKTNTIPDNTFHQAVYTPLPEEDDKKENEDVNLPGTG